MSFLSILGKIGAGIAAPFTGGASLAAIPAIDAIGKVGGVLGGAAKGSADQRIAEQPGKIGTYNANLAAQTVGDRRAILASLLGQGGIQDAQVSAPAGSTIPQFNISGGLRPSALTNRDALAQRLGTQMAPLQMPQAGTMEKVLGTGGLIGSVLGSLGGHQSGLPGTGVLMSGMPGIPQQQPPIPYIPSSRLPGVY